MMNFIDILELYMGKLETNQKQLAKGGAQVSIKCEARLNIPIVRYIVHTSWGMQKTNLVILLDFFFNFYILHI